ncbi:digeranylgeranylglycerophospholipid reductase [Halobium salinum]|uniref:Digeranylgeranylglycerophospholipid reductase n=1 Tax=Halobium salinum TaxID=1364940 RepID=A0ABD5P7J9_9EURY|nr:digeranylgeranylglycerophospholipid reductase [Halobium salinum]
MNHGDDQYEVVIAGAGPAGGQCARELAARDYDVLLLEAEPEEDFPRGSNKSTGGTFPPALSSFGLPDDVVMHYTDDVVLESPNDHYVHPRPGAVLEFAEFKRFLVRDARERGAEVRFGARANAPVMEGDELVGVRHSGGEEVYADVVVDATGPAAPLAKKLGVVDLERERQAIGIEYELDGIDLDCAGYADLTDAMMLRLDHDLAPGGYSWIFHTGADTAKVGVCYVQNDAHRGYAREGMTVDDYLQYWLDRDPRFEDAERIAGKQHRGSAHIQPPGRMSTDSFLAIGDTVPTIDPLWGEGIHVCMKSGRAAAATIDRAFIPDERDTGAENMAVYDHLWHEDVAPKMHRRLLLSNLVYLASNERYDEFMRDLRRTDEDLLAGATRGTVRGIVSLLRLEDLSLVGRALKEQFEQRRPFC